MTPAAVLARLAAATAARVVVSADAGPAGTGHGTAEAGWDGGVLVISEAGEWAPSGARPMRWRAASRWRVEGEALAVEHVRQGTPASATLDRQPDGSWVGREPHVCGADRYTATVRLDGAAVEVAWTVTGPCKAARVVTRYEPPAGSPTPPASAPRRGEPGGA